MQIHGPSHVHPPQGLSGPHNPQFRRTAEGAALPATGDQLEISPAAEAAIQAADNASVRTDLVARIKSEIASGTYETPEKLDLALNRLLNELG